MRFEGQAIRLSMIEENFAELQLDLKDESVNKFNAATLKELRQAVDELKKASGIRGLLITSAKDVFVVGADVTEFLQHFKKSEAELSKWLLETDRLFSEIEDLDYPSVVAINGFCLGGGLEFALTASYRVATADAKLGVPETKLGIYPGWGGTVRLSRLCGADNAIEWIAGGEQNSAPQALKTGVIDALVASKDSLRTTALGMLRSAAEGKLDWKARRTEKKSPLRLNPIEATMVFEGAKAFVGAKAGRNYPAPVEAISAMQEGATKNRDEALEIEARGFAKVAKTDTAHSLVSIFLGDQYVKKTAKKMGKGGHPTETAAVLGAGIMGGGIAYQSAAKGLPIYMKDINTKALDLGMSEAVKLLEKQVSRGKMTAAKMGEVLGRIRPTLSYGDFGNVDVVVEAVVENEKVKRSVLADVEAQAKPGAVIASNTSTISIDRLAEVMKHPENFCGMHFFNPVHRMPLVEIIRGKKTSEATIGTIVNYALAMGKTPIVVNDCPGFFVNRALFPYLNGFMKLLHEGVDFQRIDQVMEKFGWPMGPAYLLDVVGIDTGHHAGAVMAEGFPDRMKENYKTAMDAMFEAKRFGQKNGVGFYKYVPDKKGPPKKEKDPSAYEVLKSVTGGKTNSDITDQEIVDRMMLPMIIESSRCLEDKIIASAIEVDLSLLYGLGFPPFRGGALMYADRVGLKAVCESADKYVRLGKLYEPTAQMRELAKSGNGFYGE